MRTLPIVSVPPASAPPFVRHTGSAAPLSVRTAQGSTIDADDPTAFAFEPLAYLREHRDAPDFLLKREPYRGASILVAASAVGGESFAVGESGIPALGIRVVIAPAFGSAFFSEAVRQGILLVALPQAAIERMMAWVEANPGQAMTVDLQAQIVDAPGLAPTSFEVPDRMRNRLLNGLNDLEELLQHREDAIAFRMEDRSRRPWLYNASIDPSSGGSGDCE